MMVKSRSTHPQNINIREVPVSNFTSASVQAILIPIMYGHSLQFMSHTAAQTTLTSQPTTSPSTAQHSADYL